MTDYTSLARSTHSLVVEVLDLAQQLGYPTVDVQPSETIAGGDAWDAWTAQADRRALARALGVLVAWRHRRGVA